MPQKKPTVYEFIPKLGQLRDDVLFGDVWEHPDLSKRDRSLITVAMLLRSTGPTRCGAICRGHSTMG
jgi:4-carboxymuconolactone decarboxylase